MFRLVHTCNRPYWYVQISIPEHLPALMDIVRTNPELQHLLEKYSPRPGETQLPQSPFLYFGTGGPTTELHYDSFENMIFMADGAKNFVLIKPSDASLFLYSGKKRGGGDQRNKSPIDLSEWPNDRQHPLSRFALPLQVTVRRGDILYVPIYWFHRVQSSVSRSASLTFWWSAERQKKDLVGKVLCGYRHSRASHGC